MIEIKFIDVDVHDSQMFLVFIDDQIPSQTLHGAGI